MEHAVFRFSKLVFDRPYPALIEKILNLEEVTPVDFLGVNNKNLRILASAFPESRIISRGHVVHVQGSDEVVGKVYGILCALLAHYRQHGLVTEVVMQHYLDADTSNRVLPLSSQDIVIHGPRGVLVRSITASQERMIEAVKAQDLVFAIGPAGTGKTYAAVALAVKALKSKQVKKIVLTRPVVEAGERLGYLPGDLEEKVAPYLRPMYDVLNDLVSSEKRRYYQENDIIELAPLAYMRGRTLHNAFVILDEAQNTTATQMKMFLTRMGLGAKFIITGDPTQIDLPHPSRSGLVEAVRILKDTKGISFIHFGEQDVVRNPLVKSIIKAYAQSKT